MSFFAPSSKSNMPGTGSTAYSRSKSDSNVRSAGYTRSSPLFAWSKPARSATTSRNSSYYNRRPRDGFIARMFEKIKRALRQLIRYVRKHPFKALLPVVMALVSSGALAGLARSTGMPLPNALMQLVGAGNSVKGGYDAWYGSQDAPSDNGNLFRGVMKAASAFV